MRAFLYIICLYFSITACSTEQKDKWDFKRNPYYQPEFLRNQKILENGVHRQISYSGDSSDLGKRYLVHVYTTNGQLDSSYVKICSDKPQDCITSRFKTETHQSEDNIIDRSKYQHLRSKKKSFGDSLTVYYDSIGNVTSRTSTSYNPKTKIRSYYMWHAETGKISFRNISRYNDDGLIMYTTIYTGREGSYTINYVYNANNQLIMKIKTEARYEDESVTIYEYLDNGLLKSSKTNNEAKTIYTYKYY